MSGHTPGPWKQAHREGPDGKYRTQVFDSDGETIATLAWYPIQQPHGVISTARESNARLIAAAPDLLAAAGMATKADDDQTQAKADLWAAALFALRAAIAKAETR